MSRIHWLSVLPPLLAALAGTVAVDMLLSWCLGVRPLWWLRKVLGGLRWLKDALHSLGVSPGDWLRVDNPGYTMVVDEVLHEDVAGVEEVIQRQRLLLQALVEGRSEEGAPRLPRWLRSLLQSELEECQQVLKRVSRDLDPRRVTGSLGG